MEGIYVITSCRVPSIINFSEYYLPALQSLFNAVKKQAMTAEQFSTAGRSIGVGLSSASIIAAWTWAATIMMSSSTGYQYGISGPFWYAAGATIQILLFAIVAIHLKRKST
ncbi:hypothetical protein RCO48_09125 [Peribacillus frigoritolerans]|nr:hypothetical protein [Peribacillus frigoritolerans]